MRIKVLLENTKLKNSNLCTEHGLSLLIEKDDKDLIFDTGGPKSCAIQNAFNLGEDLSKVDAVIVSHGHNDHTGGLLDFFDLNKNAPVYLKKEVLNPYYSKKGPNKRFVGVNPKITKNYFKRLIFVDKTLEIFPDIFLIPDIHRKFPIPSTNNILFSVENHRMVSDSFKHELFMVIKEKGLTVITGCGHNGVKNIIDTSKEIFPDEKIKTVMGGFHLQAGKYDSLRVEDEEIVDIAQWLKTEGVEKIFTGHCTGINAFNVMKSILKGKIGRIYSGKEIHC